MAEPPGPFASLESEMTKIESLKPEELEALAWDIASGRVYTDRDCPPNLIPNVFMPLMFIEDKSFFDDLGFIYEYMDQAGPRSINGCPMFASMRCLNKADLKVLAERVTTLQKMRTDAIETAKAG